MSGVRLLTDAVERSIYVTGYGRVRSLTKARSTQRHKEDLVFENNINARVGEGLDPPEDGEFFIVDWLRNRNTVEFLGIWETVHNPNYGEFATIKN